MRFSKASPRPAAHTQFCPLFKKELRFARNDGYLGGLVSVTVPVTGARVRQICQYCGNFYNSEANSNVALRRPQTGGLSLPIIVSRSCAVSRLFCRVALTSVSTPQPPRQASKAGARQKGRHLE